MTALLELRLTFVILNLAYLQVFIVVFGFTG